jgi:hypothetical protein
MSPEVKYCFEDEDVTTLQRTWRNFKSGVCQS